MIVDSVNLSLKNEFTLWTSGKYEVFDISRFRYTQTYLYEVCYTVGGVSHSVSRTYFFAIKRAMARAVEGGCKNLGVFCFFFTKKLKYLKSPNCRFFSLQILGF